MTQLILLVVLSFQANQAIEVEQSADERIPLEELLTPGNLRKYQKQTKYRNKIKIIRSSLEQKARLLEGQLPKRNLAKVYRTLAEMRGLSHHALQESLAETNRKERRNKEVKRLEIRLRKLEESLSDLKLQVPFENRGEFEKTRDLMEELREQLLRQLFGQAISSRSSGSRRPESPMNSFLPPLALATTAQRGLHDLDRFTEEEFEKVQLAQKIVKRVEAFLEIAQSRLNEIDRRISGKEMDEDEENPLEFFTYADMLFSYTRAIRGVMNNIDDRAQNRQASEKDLRKSLKILSKKLDDFIPRLDSLKDLVVQEKDEELARRYREALKASSIARKGTIYGLGAPEDH